MVLFLLRAPTSAVLGSCLAIAARNVSYLARGFGLAALNVSYLLVEVRVLSWTVD
jgi:hypothetical protein